MNLLILIFFSKIAFSSPLKTEKVDLKKYLKLNNLSTKFTKTLKKHEPLSLVKMESKHNKNKKKQKLGFYILGLHPRSCRKALPIIGQYENYSKKMPFVSRSVYDEKSESLYLKFETSILPAKFIVDFQIPRITKPGSYPFTFTKGFLRGLQGQIQVESIKPNNCLLHMKGAWQGPHTGYPDLVFEVFTKTIINIGLKRLIRISKI